ncbi:chemotaxis protein CheW [Sulfitobacter sp. R18_1]|uniref:chemotaxis protein CheW n=1 Tax=Sulfitobacter sp. R18_1 TaxID=2821104 RepID=UPI001ADCBB41|nr:chemotaxis protein CheW [Sulfitobacter sp. R18_1]MBO9428587.1 chemotaxis protein CheW [Sulfitobacter sp. R18_1]
MIATDYSKDRSDYVLFSVEGHEFALHVANVKDVVPAVKITRIPQARKEVFGVLNLRGRIVTVIDTKKILDLGSYCEDQGKLNIVVEYSGEDYALMVDEVSEVLDYSMDTYEDPPRTMDKGWKALADGVHKTDDGLMLVLSVEAIMSFLEEDSIKVN